MKETLTILFPKEISPEDIKAQIPEEGFLRMYGDRNPSTEYFNNPFKPHAIIKNFMYDEEEGWMGFVEVPEPYVRKFKTYNNPVIKAALIGTKGNYKICYFELFEPECLLMDRLYTGKMRSNQ